MNILNYKNNEIRTSMINGEMYWCASDIGKILQFSDIQRQIKRLETKGGTIVPTETNGGLQNVLFINEPSLYELIFKSRLKEAITFRLWIFNEVLPKIRKTGKYEIPKSIKQLSTEKRNLLTDMWKEHGCTKPHHYINLTQEEYKLLFDDAKKKKANMTREEILTLSALESMEALALFHGNQNGYYECRDSLKNTAKMIPNSVKKELTA